jgi:hypothetical protein
MRFRAVKVLAFSLPFLLAGTSDVESQVRLGPMVGANMSTIGGDDAEDFFSNRVGVVFGGFAQLGAGRFAIQPQVLYSMKGANIEGVEGASLKLNYLQVPVLAQIRFPGAGGVTPHLILGPSLSFKLSCKLSDGDEEFDCEDVGLEAKGTDFSLIGGIGLDVGSLTIAARYDYGLTRLEDTTSPDDLYNRAFTLTVGYGIRLSPPLL